MSCMILNANGNIVALPNTHRVRKVPSWVITLLDLPLDEIAFLEVPDSSPYSMSFREYCAQLAVDPTEPIPDSMNAPDADGKKTQSIEGKNRAERMYPGRLSGLYVVNTPAPPRFAPKRRPPPPVMHHSSRYDSDSESEDEPLIPPVLMAPSAARLMHKAKHVAVHHDGSRVTFFAQDTDTLRSIVKAVITWNFERNQPNRTPQKGKYELYTLSGSNWIKQAWKKSRKLESIILPEGQMNTIVGDFKRFMSKGTKKWYQDNGLPHRRSYLFYGPPGTGKTSTIIALAGELQVAVCFLLLGDDEVSNQKIQKAMSKIPLPALLVIEDVDALFKEDRKTNNLRSPLTFSGLLNVLDGLVSVDGVVTVLTTNHIERLDPALLRAGRIDRRFKFNPPTRKEIAALFQNFYPDAGDELAKKFADKVFQRPEKQARSIATLHQHFIFTREKSAEDSVQSVDEFFNGFYPEGGEHSIGLYS